MGEVNERTSGLDHPETSIRESGSSAVGCPVGADQDGGGADIVGSIRELNPAPLEIAQHGGIMNKLAEDGDRFLLRFVRGDRNGIANAETHAEMGCAEYLHGSTDCDETIPDGLLALCYKVTE